MLFFRERNQFFNMPINVYSFFFLLLSSHFFKKKTYFSNCPAIFIDCVVLFLVKSMSVRQSVNCRLSVGSLDGFSHLYKRVCPSVGRPVGRSVCRSVGSFYRRVAFPRNRSHWNKNSVRNKTSTRAIRQRMHLLSELCSTLYVTISVGQLVGRVFYFLLMDSIMPHPLINL